MEAARHGLCRVRPAAAQAQASGAQARIKLVRLKGIEPLTPDLEGPCSIRLSYRRVMVARCPEVQPRKLGKSLACQARLVSAAQGLRHRAPVETASQGG